MLKKIFKLAGILILLLLVFIIVAPFIFKGKIIAIAKEEANKNLNAKVEFKDIDLGLLTSFPYFNLAVSNLSIANTGDFAGDTLLSANNLSLSIDLMSVIKGDQYKIRSIRVDNPRINARVLKNGKANWDIMKDTADATKQTTSEPTKFKMSLKKLELNDGHIIYDDATMGFYTLLAGFNHTLSGDFTEENFLLETFTSIKEFTVNYGGMTYLKKVNTTLKMDMDANMPNFKFVFKENEITLNELAFGVDGYFAMPKEDMDMDLKFNAKQTEFKNFLSLIPAVYTKDFASVKTAGKLSFNGFAKGIYNDKQMPAFGLDVKIDDAMFQYPSLPAAVKNINVALKVTNKNGVPDNTVIDVSKFHIEMAGNPVDIRMHVETPVSDPNIDGAIIGRVNLASVKDVVPMKDQNLTGSITADVKLKGRMSAVEKERYEDFNASGQLIVAGMNYKSNDLAYDVIINSMTLNFSPKYVELAGFDSKIGRSDIEASGKIENFLQYYFKQQLLKGTFQMNSTLLDLNQFMAADEKTATAAKDSVPLTVIEVPANIDFNMRATIGKLLYDNMEMTNVTGNIIVKDSRADLSDLKMNLLGGNMIVNGYYETQNVKRPKVNFNVSIVNFDIPQTFKTFNTVQKLAPVAKYATGKFGTDLKFTTLLDTKMAPVLGSLEGNGKLNTKMVTISGFAPLVKLADAVKMEKFKRVDFTDLNVSYAFKDGKVNVSEFPFKTGNISGNVAGSTGFDQTIDYKMNINIPRSDLGGAANGAITNLLSQANSKGANLKLGDNIALGAVFGGTVTNPTVKTSLKESTASLKEKGKELFEEKKKEVIKDIKGKASAEADKILKDAERQAQAVKDEAQKLADKVKTEGYAAADRLEKEASNPIAKIAAKKGAEKLRKEADNKAAQIVGEANTKADGIMSTAREKADKLK